MRKLVASDRDHLMDCRSTPADVAAPDPAAIPEHGRQDVRHRLGYIADMIAQLRIMAIDSDCGHLATLLATSEAESRLQLGRLSR